MATNFMKPCLFALVLSFFIWPTMVSAEISKLVFTTDPQTIKPSTLSSGLTIQTQTAEGVEDKTPETMDLSFSSDSNSGEFLNQSGDPVSKTMNKNSANRTFYYRDSSLGAHQLSVTATGRDSKKAFTATQTIIISNEATPPDNTATNTNQTSNNNSANQTSTGGGGGSNYQAYSAQSDLGNTVIHPPEVGVGRDRLGVVGADLSFEAWRKNNASGNFSWTFGDGSVSDGVKVNHRYEFPGEYQVILNAYFPEGQSVSRTKVLIIKPELAISNLDWSVGFVELSNPGAYEINLGGWILEDQTSRFIFPTDTIITSKAKIKVATNLLKLSGVGGLVLAAPNGRIASRFLVDSNQLASVANSGLSQINHRELDPLVLARRQRLVAEMRSLADLNLSDPGSAVKIDQPDLAADNPTGKIVLAPQLSWWQKAVRMFR